MINRRASLALIALAVVGAILSSHISVSSADTFRPVVRGRRAVVAGGQPLSVEAGMRILQHGGNAVDAGVATMLAASVIEFSHFSIGGEAPILVRTKDGKVHAIAGVGTMPKLATAQFFRDHKLTEDEVVSA